MSETDQVTPPQGEPEITITEGVEPPVHREVARRESRLATKLAGDAALVAAESKRASLVDVAVLYSPRLGEFGYGGPDASAARVICRVVKAHSADCADLVALDKDGAEHALASCVLAGSRDTKPGSPGTFEVV